MKKENKKTNSKIYDKELISRISEINSMILEQAGELNISNVIPNWKNIPLGELEDRIKSFVRKFDNINEFELSKSGTYASDPAFAKTFSKRWKKSKFGKMTPDEVMEYAASSPEKRKEVRDFVEEEYKWFLKNVPDSVWKSINVARHDRQLAIGKDPYDVFYRDYKVQKSGVFALISGLVIVIQLLIYLFS